MIKTHINQEIRREMCKEKSVLPFDSILLIPTLYLMIVFWNSYKIKHCCLIQHSTHPWKSSPKEGHRTPYAPMNVLPWEGRRTPYALMEVLPEKDQNPACAHWSPPLRKDADVHLQFSQNKWLKNFPKLSGVLSNILSIRLWKIWQNWIHAWVLWTLLLWHIFQLL